MKRCTTIWLGVVFLTSWAALCEAQDTPEPTKTGPETKKAETTEPEATEPETTETDAEKSTGILMTPSGPQQLEDPVPTPTEGMEVITTDSGLRYIDIKVGDGAQPVPGSTVTVHYNGWLEDGTLFDSSAKRGQPSILGLDDVIEGWKEGIGSMKVGGKRKLIVPPELGYGDHPRQGIPRNSTLIFEVDLLDTKIPPKPSAIEGLKEQQKKLLLKYWDVKVGEGEGPQPDGEVKMHYSIWLKDGTFLTSTRSRDTAATVAVARLFTGWSEGVLGMKNGGIRQLEIPPTLAFGRNGLPQRKIPPDSTIILEVELLEVINPPSDEELVRQAGEMLKRQIEAQLNQGEVTGEVQGDAPQNE